MTIEKEFTLFCIKCGAPETDFEQDSRGCEKFKKVDEMGVCMEDIFICSKCIAKFQFVEDLKLLIKNKFHEGLRIIQAYDNINVPDCPMDSSEQSEK